MKIVLYYPTYNPSAYLSENAERGKARLDVLHLEDLCTHPSGVGAMFDAHWDLALTPFSIEAVGQLLDKKLCFTVIYPSAERIQALRDQAQVPGPILDHYPLDVQVIKNDQRLNSQDRMTVEVIDGQSFEQTLAKLLPILPPATAALYPTTTSAQVVAARQRCESELQSSDPGKFSPRVQRERTLLRYAHSLGPVSQELESSD